MGSFEGLIINLAVALILYILWKYIHKAIEQDKLVEFWSWLFSFSSFDDEIQFYNSYTRKRLEKFIDDLLFAIHLASVGFFLVQLLLLPR